MTEPVPARGGAERVAAIGVLTVVCTCLLWMTGNTWFLLLAGTCAGLGVFALSRRSSIAGLAVEISSRGRVAVGEVLPAVLTVSNDGRRRSREARMCLHTAGLDILTARVPPLQSGQTVSIRVERSAVRRTVSAGSVCHVASRPFLGLGGSLRELQLPGAVVVHPALQSVAGLPETTGPDDGGDTGAVVAGGGAELLGLQQWRTGQDHGRVHWRSTARLGRPVLLERGDVTAPRVRLVLVGPSSSGGFEEAVSLAASVCDAALARGQEVTAVVWQSAGPTLAPVTSRAELLDWWAALEDVVLPEPVSAGPVLRAGFGPGTALVVGPPEADSAWTRATRSGAAGLALHRVSAA